MMSHCFIIPKKKPTSMMVSWVFIRFTVWFLIHQIYKLFVMLFQGRATRVNLQIPAVRTQPSETVGTKQIS